MKLETMFVVANTIALAGWFLLLLAPWIPKLADRVAGYGVPILLAAVYLFMLIVALPEAEGGFGSLEGVVAGLNAPSMVLTGWLHYLALDLFVGGWEVRTARREGIAFWKVAPCLVLTLLAAPVGLVVFLLVRERPALRAERQTTGK